MYISMFSFMSSGCFTPDVLVPSTPQALNKAFQTSCNVLAEEHKALGEQEQENTRIVNK